MIKLRRSMLFVPGSNARALEKAQTLPADALIFDLEDSVTPDMKAAARARVAAAAAQAGGAQLLLVHVVVELLTVVDALSRSAVDGQLTQVFDKSSWLSHFLKR